MPLCDHKEADSRIIVHIADAINKGAKTILVRTVDTDVIVIIIGVFFALLSKCSDIDIWVAENYILKTSAHRKVYKTSIVLKEKCIKRVKFYYGYGRL